MKSNVLSATIVVAAVLCVTAPVESAQSAEPSPTNPDTTLSEIVVTAEKREQRLIDVPTPVTALSASSLLEENKTRLEDYFRDVPGLSLTSAGSGVATLAVRGVTTGDTTNPTVGVTIDDVPYGSVSGLSFGSAISPPDLDPTDLQRVEVLRGPQGTLYGASSLGGVLKFVTAEPSFSGVSGRVEVDGNTIDGGGSGGGARGAVNLPLTADTVALRLSGFYRRDGGFIDDPTHGLKNLDRGEAEGGHAALLWKISEAATLKLSALFQENSADGQSAEDTNYRLVPSAGDLTQNHLPGSGAFTNRAQLYSANFTLDLPEGLKLVSVSGYAINDYLTSTDLSPTFGPYTVGGGAEGDYTFFTKRLSQEMRLQQSTAWVDWLVGTFYTDERSGDHITIGDFNYNTGVSNNSLLLDENDVFHYNEYAGFASATGHLTKDFDLQAGLRYAHNNQLYRDSLEGPLGGGYLFQQPSHDHALTYSIAPSYKISPDMLAYVRVATGYRPGGPNAGVFGVGTPATYIADRTVNYEVGFKGESFEKRLTYDASLYYVEWKDIQLGSIDPVTGFLYYQNGSSASSKGIELSATARPWSDATLTASTAIGKAQLERSLPATAAYAHKDDRLPNDAEATFSLDFEQTFPISEALTGFGGGSVNYVGNRIGMFVNTAAEVRAQMPAYTLGGLRGGIKTRTGLTVSAYVSNLGNSRGVLAAGTRGSTSLPTDPFQATIVQPRTIGLSVAKTF